jgi:hypothetical protein
MEGNIYMTEKRTMTLNLSDEEMLTLEDLSNRYDLSKTAVLRKALRIYHIIDTRLQRGEKLFMEVELIRPLDNSIVAAKLIVGLTVDEVDEAVGLWSPYLEEQLQAGLSKPQHAHWEWDLKARKVEGMPEYALCGIVVDMEIQALMLRENTFARAKHPDQRGTSIVYVAFLSTAPWNDRDIVPTPTYRGSGTLLLQEAVEHSIELGYKGRMGLHSLFQAEPFYRDRCKMIDLGEDPDPDHQGLRYLEFTKESAQSFLNSTKQNRRKP